jgi:hypothetical protein
MNIFKRCLYSSFLLFFTCTLFSQIVNNTKYDEILGPCGFAGCYANYYIGKKGIHPDIKYALLDSNKIELTKCIYDEFDLCSDYCGVWFSNGYLRVRRGDKWGFLNENGLEVIECVYDENRYFYNGLSIACKNSKWGIINESGQFVVENKYSNISGPFEEMYIVSKENSAQGKKGLMNSKGKMITPFIYDEFMYDRGELFIDGLAMVIRDTKYGWINKKGEEIIKCEFENASQFSSAVATVKENGKWGVVNVKGENIILNRYDTILQINDSFDEQAKWFAFVHFQNNPILINKKEEKIIDFPFLRIEPFSSGMAAVLDSSNHWGFVDTTYFLQIPCIYDYIPDDCIMSWQYPPKFTGSICLVMKDYICRIIDVYGKPINWSDCCFDIPPYENFFSIFCCNGKYGLIDHTITIRIPCIYNDFQEMWHFQPFELYGECKSNGQHFFIKAEDLIPTKLSDHWGYIDRNGVVKIPFIYEQISHFESGKAKVKLNGIEFFIDENGNRIP